MSVLIKDFEMPKDGCKDCAMVKRGFVSDTCPFLKQEVSGNVERGGKPYGCPLIEVPDTDFVDTIYRQAAIEALRDDIMLVAPSKVMEAVRLYISEIEERIRNLPSAQLDYDLSGYSDKLWKAAYERGRAEAQPEQRWIPVKTRPTTEEERQYYSEMYGYDVEYAKAVMFDCKMPEDGQEVWVCSKCGNVWQDTCVVDVGIGLEKNWDWDDIVAWMPFVRPEPWNGTEDKLSFN